MKSRILLLAVLFLAALFRLYNLASVPPSPSLDEVSIGYNAYSILRTGRDEYGSSFPILLRAYDDWRPALYVYLVAPSEKIFGLNTLAVRLPSVILSLLTVIATYFLVKELFPKYRILPIATASLLAISPWHIYISRLGHEANAGLAFLVFAVLVFLKKRFYLSSLFFVLSFMSYQAEKIVIPIVLIGLVLLFRNELLARKKQAAFAFLLGSIILVPFLRASLTPNALIRFEATSIFNAQKERFEKQAILLARDIGEGNVIGQAFHNRRVLAAQIVLEGYLSHFNPAWLFANQSSDRHKTPGLGLLYIWEVPLILLGFITLIRKKIDHRVKALLFLWFFSAPLGAALTTDAPHAMRSYTFLPTWQIFSAVGILASLQFLENQRAIKVFFPIYILIVFVSIFYFFRQYFFVFPKTQSQSFQFALSQALPFILENQSKYDKVVISNRDNLYQSYMFFLYYSRYNPSEYQNFGGTMSGGFAQPHYFDTFEFRPIVWDKEKKSKRTLYVGNPSEFPQEAKAIFESRYLDETLAIKIVEGDK